MRVDILSPLSTNLYYKPITPTLDDTQPMTQYLWYPTNTKEYIKY